MGSHTDIDPSPGQPAPSGAAADETLAGKPHYRLQRRLMWWMILLVTTPAAICMAVINQQVRAYLLEQRQQDTELLAQVVSTSLAGRIDNGWSRHGGELIDSLHGNPRVAFVAVTNAKGRPLHVGAFDAQAWDNYSRSQFGGNGRTLDVREPALTLRSSEIVIRNVPIWGKSLTPSPTPPADGAARANAPKLEGFLVLAMHDQTIFQKIDLIQLATILTVVGVCAVSLLLVAVVLRSWSAPLRGLLEGTRKLAQGQSPEPISVNTNDEMGFLAAAFNDMGSRLIASQQELIEANETLDQKVKSRTRELQAAVEKLDQMASTDALTKMANRRAFDDHIPEMFSAAKLGRRELAVAVIDLDGFKGVNDTYGHERGDQLLVLTADIIRRHVRPRDLAARTGGDEFVILMPGAELDEASRITQAISEQFESDSRGLFEGADTPPKVSASIGLSFLTQTDPATSDELIAQADHAMYQAKEAGKSCLRVYETPAGADTAPAPSEAA